MSQARVTRSPWTCECGRKIPAHIETCRCGKARPADAGATGAAEWAESKSAVRAGVVEKESDGLFSTKSLLQVGGVILLIGLFFGSRYFNRYRASRDVKAMMVSELSKEVGAATANELVEKVHWTCFEPNYQMSFRRRGGSATFDEKAYSTCAFRALEREAGQIRTARQKTALEADRAARESRRQAAEARVATTPSAPLPGPAAAESSVPPTRRTVAISGLSVTRFTRASTHLVADFLVIGSGAETFSCHYSLTCGADQRMVSEGDMSCLRPRDAVRADGQISFVKGTPAPEGPCSLSVSLSDGRLGNSNRATVAIP